MAKGRIRSRMELREQYDAAEARERDGGDEEPEAAEEGGEGEEEAAPAVKKKKKTTTKESKPRKKVVKAVRRRVVWVVFDNSNKKIAQYDYTKKQDADDHAARLATEKKQTYFVQPVKEPIEE
jgi:hypothetical protein